MVDRALECFRYVDCQCLQEFVKGFLGRLRGLFGALKPLFRGFRSYLCPHEAPKIPKRPPKSNPRRTKSKKLRKLALPGLPGHLIFLPQIDQNRPKISVKQHSKIASFLKLISDGISIDLGSVLSQLSITFHSMLAIILKSVEIQKMKTHRFFNRFTRFWELDSKLYFRISEVRS